MASDGTIKIRTELDDSKAKAALQRFSESTKKAIGKSVSIAVKTATASITAFAGYSVKVGADFEAGMSRVSAISGATGQDLEALTGKAKEMGAKTKFSATEAASAFEYMAMAGWKTKDMLDGIEGIMNLAAASGEDLAATSDIVTDALTAFGLKASDSGHFADVLAKAASSANTNVGMMGDTFKYAAPIAGALKYSVEDAATAIGLMANAGIKGEQAGTTLRAMLTRLVKPPKEAADALDALGISAVNADGTMKPLKETMDDLRKGFAGLDDSQKASYASSIAGQEAMSGLLAIVNASDADFNNLVASINHADGAAKSMADTMQNNLKGSITILGSAVEGFGIQVYEKVQGPLKGVADTATESVNRTSKAFASGGLNGVIAEAGELFNDLADSASSSSSAAAGVVEPLRDITNTGAGLVKKVLPVAADSVRVLAKNFDILAPAAVAAVSAFKAFKIVERVSKWYKGASAASAAYATAMAAEGIAANASSTAHILLASTMSAYELAVGVVTAKVPLATAAQVMWNKALNANPIGAVVVAALALAAAAAAVRASIQRETEAEREHAQELKNSKKEAEEHAEAAKERKKSYDDLVDSQNKQAAADVAQLNNLENLNNELKRITDKNGKVKAGEKERAAFITSQLSSALGVEISMTGNQINNYQKLQKEIQNLIQQKKIDAVMSAQQAKYEEAVSKQMEVAAEASRNLTAMKKAEVSVSKEQEKLTALQNDYNDAVINGNKAQVGILGEKIKRQEENVSSAENALKKEKKAYAENTELLAQYANDIDMYTALAEAAASGNAKAIEDAISQVTAGLKLAGNATSEELQKQVVEIANTENMIQKEVEAGTPGFTQAMLTQAQDATKAALEEFAKAAPQTAKELSKVSPEAVAALIAGGMKGKLSAEAKGAVEGMLGQFDGMDQKTREDFAQVWYGALEGLEGFEQLADPAKEGADAFLESLKTALEVHSPSAAARRIFSQVWPGATEGLDEGSEDLKLKGNEVISSFLGDLGKIGGSVKGVGSKIMKFFSAGILSQKKSTKAAGKGNADAALTGVKSVNPKSSGSKFGTLFGDAVGGTASTLLKKGKTIATNAKTGAGSVNPSGEGVKFGSSYASGIARKTKEAKSKGKSLASNAESGAKSKTGYSAGSGFGSGFVKGIGDWIKSAAKKAADMAKSALSAAKKALDSHSPSKKSRKIGKTVPQGFGLGIEDDTKLAEKASENMSKAALKAVDVSELTEKIRSVDVPETMARVYMTVEDRQDAVADKIVRERITRKKNENLESTDNNMVHKMSDEDIRMLGKIFAEKAAPVMVKAFAESGIEVKMYGEKVGILLSPEINNSLSTASMKAGRYMK